MDTQPEQGLLRPPPPASLLPEDMLADILAHLAPRCRAMARSVCKAWLATVDEHNLLRTDLLPLTLVGIFVNFWNHPSPEYFSRSSPGHARVVSGHQMEYAPTAGEPSMRTRILGQCNGLLLLEVANNDDHDADHHVVNPATRAWARVPPAPSLANEAPAPGIFFYRSYFVFDPTLLPYYEVISFPHVKWGSRPPLSATVAGEEWPLSRCVLRVFSSRVNRWEERSFAREGGAAATFLDMSDHIEHRYSTYSRGALYVLCQAHFVMRISLSHNKYRVVKPPGRLTEKGYVEPYLGKSKKGVYLASCYFSDILHVWMLDESCGRMEWSLKHSCDLTYVLRHNYQQASGPWVLNDANYNFYRHCFPNHVKEEPIEEKYEWDSDNDNVLGNEDTAESHKLGMVSVLGFHPFKEVIYLNLSVERGLAYHWNSSKVQDLGKMYPTEYGFFDEWGPDIEVAFPYTPCWM